MKEKRFHHQYVREGWRKWGFFHVWKGEMKVFSTAKLAENKGEWTAVVPITLKLSKIHRSRGSEKFGSTN